MTTTGLLFPELEAEHCEETREETLHDARVVLYSSFYSQADAERLFSELRRGINWNQDHISLYGKKHPLPRLTAWYGEPGIVYDYSGIVVESIPWTDLLQSIRSKVQDVTNESFNSVLLNFYRSGKDGVAWHSDDEPVLGPNPIIASVSFGHPRKFLLRHKRTKQVEEYELGNGDILLMAGTTQGYWEHQVPKTKKDVGERINLTFRRICN